jgi:hypothetical protein
MQIEQNELTSTTLPPEGSEFEPTHFLTGDLGQRHRSLCNLLILNIRYPQLKIPQGPNLGNPIAPGTSKCRCEDCSLSLAIAAMPPRPRRECLTRSKG